MEVNEEHATYRWKKLLIILTCISSIASIALAIIPEVEDRWTYLATLSSIILFFLTLWETTHNRISVISKKITDANDVMNAHVEKVNNVVRSHITSVNNAVKYHVTNVNIALSLKELDAKVKRLSYLSQKHSIVKEYLCWLINRQKILLDLPFKGSVKVLDPDYFGFATLVFNQAKKKIRSTSLVDPYWYDSNECAHYIENQVACFIKKGRTYTRYFIVNPSQDTEERKLKTVSIIKDLSEKGFNILVVHTNNYETEYDAAEIDNGQFWLLASVPRASYQSLPEAEIRGCECLFDTKSQNQKSLYALQGYFGKLDDRVQVQYDSKNFNSVTLEAVY